MDERIEKEFAKVETYQKMKYPLLDGCIRDGILYPEAYGRSPFRMVVILKEPYASWDEKTQSPTGGDFDFSDIINNLEYHYDKGLSRTWLRIASMAYSLKNRCPYTEGLSLGQIREGLECVCWINLSKTPWKTLSDVKDSDYLARVKDWESVVRLQLELTDSDVIFYGYTWDCSSLNPIEPERRWDRKKVRNERIYGRRTADGRENTVSICGYEGSDRIIVNGYHPGYGNSAQWQAEAILDYMSEIRKKEE